MALYSRHDYLNLRPFHGFGDAGVPPDPDAGSIDGVPQSGLGIDLSALPQCIQAPCGYQTPWPGVASEALKLWPGAAPIVNDADFVSPMPNTAPSLLARPADGAVPTWVWVAAAAAGYWFFLR